VKCLASGVIFAFKLLPLIMLGGLNGVDVMDDIDKSVIVDVGRPKGMPSNLSTWREEDVDSNT
jgi:hypothetical protein